MRQPLAYDLFAGLGGWTDGLLAEGWRCIGYDIEAHEYWAPAAIAEPEGGMKGTKPVAKRGWTAGCAVTLGVEGANAQPRMQLLKYPAELRLQDVMTLNGADLADADLIVASPPCQAYSYMAMPWTLAKAKAADIRADTTGEKLAALNALFNACFRIQREASAAAGRHIPMVVENVRGAIPWVGRSQWNYGSFHLWGDVPALMPATQKAQKVPGFRFDGSGKSFQTASVEATGVKAPGMNWSDQTKRGQDFTRLAGKHAAEGAGTKNAGGSWFNIGGPGQKVTGQNPVHEVDGDNGTKIGGDWFSDPNSTCRKHGSKSKGRKMASAMIAKIPLPLSRHIAATFRPQFQEAAE